MPEDSLRQELRMLMTRAAFLDLAAYLLSIPFLGVTASFALGLLLGTAVLLCSLLLLSVSVRKTAEDAKRFGTASQRRHQLFYALRLTVFAAGFGTAIVLRAYISPLGTALPMLYPRLIYTAGALFSGSDISTRKR